MLNHGVLNLLKPPGMTSHDAVAHVRRVLKTKRVGHTGTLDPAAAGVLPICVGLATRLVETLQQGTKEYLAEATFGYETDTLDAVGETIRECDATTIDREKVENACAAFRGSIEQQPPLHSAIKIGGQKLYDIARAGGDIEIPTRTVTISDLQVTRFVAGERPTALLRVECSGGTYIRSLVRDIGRQLGNAATMTFLSRARSGRFDLSDSVTPQEFGQSPRIVPLQDVLQTLYGPVRVDESETLALWQGKRIPWKRIRETSNSSDSLALDSLALWSNHDQTLWAIGVFDGQGHWKADKVFDLRAEGDD